MGEHAHSLRVQNQTEFLMCHKVTQKTLQFTRAIRQYIEVRKD